VLRTRNPVHALSPSDRDDALQLCAQDLPANVFVAARLLEGVLTTQPGTLLGLRTEGTLRSVCWSSANLVPVQADADSLGFFADRVRRWRRHCASILGPADQVSELWRHLGPTWGPARAVRSSQPLMSTMTRPSELGMPAAAQMFEGEIGYPPYTGSGAAYRQALQALIDRGHTFVVVEDGVVVFKADVGSVALGCAQLQGVWLHPELRGQGLAVPMMAAVVEQVMATRAKWVTLYVNDFNASARSTYRHVGFEDVGTFSTVLL
jgi:hypothetical protein